MSVSDAGLAPPGERRLRPAPCSSSVPSESSRSARTEMPRYRGSTTVWTNSARPSGLPSRRRLVENTKTSPGEVPFGRVSTVTMLWRSRLATSVNEPDGAAGADASGTALATAAAATAGIRIRLSIGRLPSRRFARGLAPQTENDGDNRRQDSDDGQFEEAHGQSNADGDGRRDPE